MPRQKSADKLEALKLKISQLDAQKKALEARQKETDRKADTRRKVIAGALALEHIEKNAGSDFARTLMRLLDEYVTRPADRALFPSLPTKTEENDETKRRLAADEILKTPA